MVVELKRVAVWRDQEPMSMGTGGVGGEALAVPHKFVYPQSLSLARMAWRECGQNGL